MKAKLKLLLIIGLVLVALGVGLGFLVYEGILWPLEPEPVTYKVKGIDISNHQGKIDFANIDDAYQFVYMKSSEGNGFLDKSFKYNIANAYAHFKYVGAYHFFHFSFSGLSQAKFFIETVGKSTNLPPVIDVEFVGNPSNFETDNIILQIKIMSDELEKFYGVKPILYVTAESFKTFIKDRFDNRIWLRSIIFPISTDEARVVFWQYHDRARVGGIKTKVDLNVFKGSLEELANMVVKWRRAL